MAANNLAARQKVIHFIQEVPYSAEEKQTWLAQLDEDDVSEEMRMGNARRQFKHGR